MLSESSLIHELSPQKGFYTTEFNYKPNQTNLENNTINDPEKACKNHLRTFITMELWMPMLSLIKWYILEEIFSLVMDVDHLYLYDPISLEFRMPIKHKKPRNWPNYWELTKFWDPSMLGGTLKILLVYHLWLLCGTDQPLPKGWKRVLSKPWFTGLRAGLYL